MNAQKQITALRNLLHKHNHSYYVLDSPTISDYDFDMKLKELQALEAAHPEFYDPTSPSLRVGGAVTKNFNTVEHEYRMYSLDNSYSKEDLLDWQTRCQKILGDVDLEFTCELKYDGASISITYENGKLVRAVTRGDGFKGDDVTQNVMTIANIPHRLHGSPPDQVEVRGEIYLPKTIFAQLNQERDEEGCACKESCGEESSCKNSSKESCK